ncbi:MAG: hypothetical protein M3421_15750 [Bacteroidota bacterium]|nr:hypothetical protein [Bacteroidota bacterium]
MLKYILLFTIAAGNLFYCSNGFGQELNYTILWKNDSIGFLKANRGPSNNFVKYNIQSDVSVRFLAKVDMVYKFENIYSNGVLVKGTSSNFVNDKKRSFTLIKWDGKNYTAQVDDDEVSVPNKPIKFSMTSLYYKEPIGLNEIFSERFAVYCAINEISPHKYELTLPNGKKNYYTYKDGICTLVEVNHAIATFYFKLQDNDGKIVLN